MIVTNNVNVVLLGLMQDGWFLYKVYALVDNRNLQRTGISFFGFTGY